VELETPFPRLTYAEAMARYGTDKPDLRFDLEIVDVTEVLQRADFRLFQGTKGTPQRIRGIRVPGGARLSRKELDELQEVAKRGGAAGALWVKRGDDGLSGQFAKGLDEAAARRVLRRHGAGDGRPVRRRGRRVPRPARTRGRCDGRLPGDGGDDTGAPGWSRRSTSCGGTWPASWS
jgi:aspartyl-tRNA synthetase